MYWYYSDTYAASEYVSPSYKKAYPKTERRATSQLTAPHFHRERSGSQTGACPHLDLATVWCILTHKFSF